MAAKGKGFFEKDKDFGQRLDETYERREHFVVLGIERDTPFHNPKTGEVVETRTKLRTRRLNPETLSAEGPPVEVKTLSTPIYNSAEESVPEDWPAVVFWDKVQPSNPKHSEATVLRFVSEYPVPEFQDGM